MTDRCDAAARRPHDYSSADTSCEPTREESATSSVSAQQATEREAEARRNAYFASGADEGGRSRNASSDVGAVQMSTRDDPTARIIANARKYDPPIQSDPLGNALVGIAAGGLVAGVEAAVGKVGLAGARGVFLQPMSRTLVKDAVVGEATGGAAFAKGAATGAAGSAAASARNTALIDGAPALAGRLVDATNRPLDPIAVQGTPAGASSESPRTTSSVVGRSSKDGASVPVREPVHTQAPRIPERMPEALSPAEMRVQG